MATTRKTTTSKITTRNSASNTRDPNRVATTAVPLPPTYQNLYPGQNVYAPGKVGGAITTGERTKPP